MENSKIDTFEFSSSYPDPNFKSTTSYGKKWINFGVDNQLPAYIDKLVDFSPIHSAILGGTSLLVNANGFAEPNDLMLRGIYENVNSDESFEFNSNTLNDILPSIVLDQQKYGAFAINIRWSKDRSRIADYSYVPVSGVRIAIGEDEGYWVSEDWTNTKKYEPKFIHKFSSDPKIKKEFPSQLIYSTPFNTRYYALPKYWSAREVIESDQELDTYNLNRLRNSFMVNAVIKYGSIPSKEQKDALYKQLKSFYSGAKNSSKTLVLYDDNVTIEKFESNSTPRDYEWIQNVIIKKIMTAWNVVGKGGLFGLNIQEGGVEFSTDGLLNEFEVYNKMSIRPAQNQIEYVFNNIAKINGYKGEEKLEIIPIKLFETANQTVNKVDSNNNLIDDVKLTDKLMDKIQDNL